LNGKLIGDYTYGNEEIASFIMNNGQPSGVIPAGNTSTLSREYIEASWINKDKFDYVYNLVSYGAPINGRYVAEEDLRPSIYLGKMLKKAFQNIGYTLNSDFFTTGIGANLILQYMGDGFTSQDANSFRARAFGDVIVSTDPLPPPTITNTITYYRLIPNQVISNPNAIYDNVTGLFTITSDGEYTFSVNANIVITSSLNFFTGLTEIVIRDSVSFVEYATLPPNNPLPYPFQNPKTESYEFLGDTSPAQMPAGTYEIVFKHGSISTIGNTATITLNNGSDFGLNFQENITVGQTYSIGITLPEYKVLDVLGGLQNMFNLYFETDNQNKTVTIEPKTVLIKPISQGVDFSDKLDVQNQLTTDFIISYNRYLRFKFKEDSGDGFQEAFNLEKGEIFGSVQYDLGTDFKEGFTDTGTNFFAATLQFGTHPWTPAGEQCPVPIFWKENALSPPKSYDFEPRILYYKGYQEVFLANGRKAAWNWLNVTITNVPLSFMADPNVNEPNPVNILYSDTEETNGLARTYYNSDIAIISDKRVHRAFFRLTATQFYQLDLYKPIYLDHVNYRGWYYINQVVDFSPNKENTTLFELTRAFQSIPITRPFRGIPIRQSSGRQQTAMGGGTRPSGLAAVNESAVLYNGSGNVGLVRGGGVIMGNAGIQSVNNQHVFGNYNFPNTSIWVVGAGNPQARYNGLQFTNDGRILEHGGKIYVQVDDNIRDVIVEMDVDGMAEYSETFLTGER
jgi:hypothetical protein